MRSLYSKNLQSDVSIFYLSPWTKKFTESIIYKGDQHPSSWRPIQPDRLLPPPSIERRQDPTATVESGLSEWIQGKRLPVNHYFNDDNYFTSNIINQLIHADRSYSRHGDFNYNFAPGAPV